MRRANAATLLLATWLSGCGGGGSPAEEVRDPTEILGIFLVDPSVGIRGVHPGASPFLQHDGGTTPVGLFDAVLLSGADAGRTFVIASPTDDPDFGALVARLTNGADEPLLLKLLVGANGGGRGGVEGVVIQRARGLPGPDLIGSTITRIELRVDAFTVDSPGTDRNQDGNWTDFTATIRITFFGVRNEP